MFGTWSIDCSNCLANLRKLQAGDFVAKNQAQHGSPEPE
jgi:hypothetical protein